MASLPPSLRPSKFAGVLQYFDQYDYPLTRQEQIFWWSPKDAQVSAVDHFGQFSFLPGRQKIVQLRQDREKISQEKWKLARAVGERLKQFGFIQAVFVTGSLAMNNTKADDDIDFMVVTSANTLWITRLLVNLYLSSIRRHPYQKHVANVICINLWLDRQNLSVVHNRSLYTAHEIMQAKVLWDRNDMAKKFLAANAWVKDFLPNAYPNLKFTIYNLNSNFKLQISNLLVPVNLFFFGIQYLYMRSKMTTERVGLGFAFFHPTKS